MKNLLFTRIEDLFVVCHGKNDPSDEEWEKYVKFWLEEGQHIEKVLVHSEGGKPTGPQRKKMYRKDEKLPVPKLKKVPTVLLSDSLIMKTVGKAISWVNAQLKILQPNELAKGLDYLGFPPEKEQEVKKTINSMLEQLD